MRDPNSEIKKLEDENLYRAVRYGTEETGTNFCLNDKKLINFCSNNYLGLCSHNRIKNAAKKAIDSFGVGSGASRLISGGTLPHMIIEDESASFFNKESAIYFSNGYAASLGTLGSIVQENDIVIIDKLCHASLIDGAKLSGATLRSFSHNDLTKLEKILTSSRNTKKKETRILIITEGIFSMDGDSPPLPEIVDLKKKYNALLMVDEAHSFGVCGNKGKGILHSIGLEKEVDFIMATFGKSAGAAGAVTATSKIWKDLIVNKARSFIYSTAPMPSQAAAASEGLKIINGEEGDIRREKLKKNVTSLCNKLEIETSEAAITPIMIGDESSAINLSNDLIDHGIYAPAIRYPTVARGMARIRITLSSDHTEEEVMHLANTLIALRRVK